MEPTPATDQGPLSGSAPLYKRPEPLNPDQHAKLGLKRSTKPFGFAAGQHFLPLLASEFAPAAGCYPIIFAGAELTPLAVMGINPGQNLYISADGSVRPDAYLPAYIRRYPFIVANDQAMGRLVVCVDVGSDLVAENADLPFFENGKATKYTEDSIGFCQNFDQERARTETFVKTLRDLDLFEERQANHTPLKPDGTPGEPQMIATYFAVSEAKLSALPQEDFLRLRETNALGVIYAHLVSLWGWDRLIALAIDRNMKARDMQTVANA